MKLETYKWNENKETCIHDDCFTCPYPDCVASSRRIYQLIKKEKQEQERVQKVLTGRVVCGNI